MIKITSNIDELIQRFELLNEKAKSVDFSDSLVVGVNAAKAAMQFRIFNKGLDVAGQPLGPYGSRDWKRIRAKKGRQIVYKDLEYTGSLRRGMVVIKRSPTKVDCAIPNEHLFLIATSQEKSLRTTIFRPTKEEIELMVANINAAIKQQYDGLFGTL